MRQLHLFCAAACQVVNNIFNNWKKAQIILDHLLVIFTYLFCYLCHCINTKSCLQFSVVRKKKLGFLHLGDVSLLPSVCAPRVAADAAAPLCSAACLFLVLVDATTTVRVARSIRNPIVHNQTCRCIFLLSCENFKSPVIPFRNLQSSQHHQIISRSSHFKARVHFQYPALATQCAQFFPQ